MTERSIDVKVYYEDTDSLGVVYYANYFKYYERGRTEFIEALGRSIADWNAAGYNVAVYKVTAVFHKAARLSDRLTVRTELSPKSPFRILMKQQILRGDELVNNADVELVCLDANFGLQEFPQEMLGH